MSLTLRHIILLIFFSNSGTLGIVLDERNRFRGNFLSIHFIQRKANYYKHLLMNMNMNAFVDLDAENSNRHEKSL
ncbi:Uncharacterized protein APZ42_032584 [Daphnia magna]|uniref:Secreted protein n=1 Tax=Daphnia magna TaxID=35525 RepID=A0A164LNC9_9CRUS|nr:Uncharacterized protein APZ42_032584 [Daphnia magna]